MYIVDIFPNKVKGYDYHCVLIHETYLTSVCQEVIEAMPGMWLDKEEEEEEDEES